MPPISGHACQGFRGLGFLVSGRATLGSGYEQEKVQPASGHASEGSRARDEMLLLLL